LLAEVRMRFVVLGAAGQLGRDLCPRLPGDVTALDRSGLDLTRPDDVAARLRALRPDVVINCAAYNLVDRAESEPEVAFAVNAWGVRHLALACRDLGCVLAHFGSDYDFGLDDGRNTPYAVTDAPGPVSVYGLSKLAGEYLVRALCPRHFVIRTCGLYGLLGQGGKGGNFVETMLRLGGAGKPLRVVANQRCTPSATADVAEAVVPLVQSERYGLYHVTNDGSCTWYEFACAIFAAAGIKSDVTPVTAREYGAAARRPAYSVLASNVPLLRPWQEALAAYLSARKASRDRRGTGEKNAP
jgi:dTDP-4-dehydrorhamnose reductase